MIGFDSIAYARGGELLFVGTSVKRQASSCRLDSFFRNNTPTYGHTYCHAHSNLADAKAELFGAVSVGYGTMAQCVAIHNLACENLCPDREDRRHNFKCVKIRYHIWFDCIEETV